MKVIERPSHWRKRVVSIVIHYFSCERTDTSRHHHQATQGSCCFYCSRELPRGPVDPTSCFIPATPVDHELLAVVQPPNAETRESIVAVHFTNKSPVAERMETTHNQTLTPSPAMENTPTAARSLIIDIKEVVRKESPPSLSARGPKYILRLLSPIRLVSVFCITTGTYVFLTPIGLRSPCKGSCLGVLLAGGFAFHDVLWGELGWTTCGLHSVLRWVY